MPVSGMEAFNKSLGFDNLMQQILGRNQLKQKTEHEKAAMAQLERHFQAQLGLSKAAAGRAGLASSDAHKLAMMKMDPNREVDQIQRLLALANGNQSTNTQEPAPQNNDLLHQKLQSMGMFGQQHEIHQGEGMIPMQEQEQEQTPQYPVEEPMANTAPANQGSGKPNLMQMIVGGMLKKHMGVNPFAPQPQTPQEKEDIALDLFKKKEAIKSEKEEKMPAAVRTLHENIIHLSPKAVDAIQHLIDIPSPFEPPGLGFIYSGQKAAHSKAVKAAAENYAKAKGWPNTKGSIHEVMDILDRGTYETDFDYRNRLRGYQDELNNGVKSSNQFLHPNKKNETHPVGDVIEYVRVNGKLVPKGKK